jgi:general secretion pathway protein G
MSNLINRLQAAEARLREENNEKRGRNIVRRLGDKGFTLIELLVVITILGILSAIVVFSVAGITDKGQSSACKTDKATFATAMEAYFANHNPGAYPLTEAALAPQYMSTVSSMYDLGTATATAYTIVPQPAGACLAFP